MTTKPKAKAKRKAKVPPKTGLQLIRETCKTFDNFVESPVTEAMLNEVAGIMWEYGYDEANITRCLRTWLPTVWLFTKE